MKEGTDHPKISAGHLDRVFDVAVASVTVFTAAVLLERSRGRTDDAGGAVGPGACLRVRLLNQVRVMMVMVML
jgi:hypothetical protein